VPQVTVYRQQGLIKCMPQPIPKTWRLSGQKRLLIVSALQRTLVSAVFKLGALRDSQLLGHRNYLRSTDRSMEGGWKNSESYPTANSGINGANCRVPVGVNWVVIIKVGSRGNSQEEGMWMQLAHYCVHWTRVSAALNLQVSMTLKFGHCQQAWVLYTTNFKNWPLIKTIPFKWAHQITIFITLCSHQRT
jgi:hypothetical protein